jgi:hypothetical protein
MIKEDVEEEYECMMWLSVIILSDKDNNIYGFIKIYLIRNKMDHYYYTVIYYFQIIRLLFYSTLTNFIIHKIILIYQN